MANDPTTLGLLLAAVTLATILYGMLLRRRHGAERLVNQNMNAITDNYGRSGLP
jgi:hypothetical protein